MPTSKTFFFLAYLRSARHILAEFGGSRQVVVQNVFVYSSSLLPHQPPPPARALARRDVDFGCVTVGSKSLWFTSVVPPDGRRTLLEA